MISELEEKKMNVIRRFYNKLVDILIRDKQSIESVFFIFLLNKYLNSIHTYLRESAIDKREIEPDIFQYLENEGYIEQIDQVGFYVITPKGVWEYELQKGTISISKLLKYIHSRIYTFEEMSKKKLNGREKGVLFASLAIRAFSENDLIDLNKSHISLRAWKEIIEKSIQKLKELGGLPESYSIDDFYGKGRKKLDGLEDPIIHAFRHIDQLPRKTMDIFQNTGKSRYYLAVTENEVINFEKIRYLLNRIFGRNLEFADYSTIVEFFEKISLKYCTLIFDSDSGHFSTPETNQRIREALLFGL